MKLLSFLTLLFVFHMTFLAHAGRETHGFLPDDHFLCQSEQSSKHRILVELPLTERKVTAAQLTFLNNQYDFKCIDQYIPANITEQLSLTVICVPNEITNDQNQKYRLELFESKSKSQIRIWRVRPGRSDQMIKALPCY